MQLEAGGECYKVVSYHIRNIPGSSTIKIFPDLCFHWAEEKLRVRMFPQPCLQG
jgi:hypothetical protein